MALETHDNNRIASTFNDNTKKSGLTRVQTRANVTQVHHSLHTRHALARWQVMRMPTLFDPRLERSTVAVGQALHLRSA